MPLLMELKNLNRKAALFIKNQILLDMKRGKIKVFCPEETPKDVLELVDFFRWEDTVQDWDYWDDAYQKLI